jgi:hypothetical protein
MDLNEIEKKHHAIMFHLQKDAPELAKILREVTSYTFANLYSHTIKNTLMYLVKHHRLH